LEIAIRANFRIVAEKYCILLLWNQGELRSIAEMSDPPVARVQNSAESHKTSRAGWYQLIVLGVVSGLIAFAFNGLNPSGIRMEEKSEIGQAFVAVPGIAAEAENQLGGEARLLDSEFVHHGEISDDGFPIVSWEQVESLVKEHNALPVDARPEWSFEAGHLPGAVCLPFSFPTTQAFHEFSSQHPKTRPLVIYCGEPSCERSKYLAIKLRDDFEYANLWLYEGGYEDYLDQTR
jgi:rhodanese-related sulfurtransferase